MKVFYYSSSEGDSPISDFLDSLSQKQQAKLIRIFSTIEEYGLQSVLPHIKSISGYPLWEIRVIGKDNIRAVYARKHKDSIIILHGFVKKKQKTPLKEIIIAMTRYHEITK
ncbi:MAG: type II toxin-antitoxin system RelE/ParE family toxin [bacterium]|nr:type II toxin-antitoxin system RelE/ParE family toxin [bacterium]